MHLLPISVSARQLSKLRKGHPVRIKKGRGCNLVVAPGNFRLASRAFAKNKGLEIKLSPEEIEANRSLSPEQHAQLAVKSREELKSILGEAPEMAGRGIFDDFIKHPATKQIAKELLPELKDLAKDAAKEYIKSGGSLRNLHNQTLGNLASNALNTSLSDGEFLAKHTLEPFRTVFKDPLAPRSRGSGMRSNNAQISGRGTRMMSDDLLPPALRSQPYGANFHMQFQLPPQYHKFNSGGEELGNDGINGYGLYA
jgi:hypothetical protein